MINKNKRDKPIISECTCRGLNLLEKLSQYYVDRLDGIYDQSPKNKEKQYDDAKKLSHELVNIVTDKGVTYSYDLPPVESFKRDINIKNELEYCEQYKKGCVITLERLMGRLHQSPEAQDKLICGHSSQEGPPYLDQDIVDRFLSDIFRGEFYDENTLKVKYDPFNEWFHKEHIDACKRYKK